MVMTRIMVSQTLVLAQMPAWVLVQAQPPAQAQELAGLAQALRPQDQPGNGRSGASGDGVGGVTSWVLAKADSDGKDVDVDVVDGGEGSKGEGDRGQRSEDVQENATLSPPPHPVAVQPHIVAWRPFWFVWPVGKMKAVVKVQQEDGRLREK